MSGLFRVVWKDYFGFEHEDVFWARTAEGAVRIMESEFEYQYELVSVNLIDGMPLGMPTFI